MVRHTSFSLGEHFAAFIDEQVESGRYASASEVVRDSLRLLEEEEGRRAAIRSALIEGERSGPSTSFDFEAFLTRKRRERTPPG